MQNFHLGDLHPERAVQDWDIREVLWHMIRTKRYCPHAHWCIPQQGKGMWWGKAQALWRLCTDPENATQDDINIVFFEAPEGCVNGPWGANIQRVLRRLS